MQPKVRTSSSQNNTKLDSSSRRSAKSACRAGHNPSKNFMSSDRKRHRSHKRNRPRMEHRYNSNKVLDYKRTPSKTKKRTLQGSGNNSFVASGKYGSKSSFKDNSFNMSKEHLYSDRRTKSKKYEKRAMSSGIRRAKELYLADDNKSSLMSSSKKEKSSYKRYEDSSSKVKKSKSSYKTGMNYYFSQPQGSSQMQVLKQHQIVKKHIDHKIPSNSFQYNPGGDMFSPSNSGKVMNNSAILSKSGVTTQAHQARRMNGFNAPPNKSRDQHHYRINSNSHSNKFSDGRSSSVVHPSDLTPLHSNCIKTVKTKNTEDTIIGSNAYKSSTMENSIKKMNKKSLNLSSNQYHEYPTTADWHSSLVNPNDENIEEIHFIFVKLHQKKKKLIERIEKAGRNLPTTSKKGKKKQGKRSSSAKRRRGEVPEHHREPEAQYEYIAQKNSNIEL
jgi:hypothetical protein